MAMEVACGQCHGRLLIETPGVVVACPHCGVHLSIPVPDSDSPAASAENSPPASKLEEDVPAEVATPPEIAVQPELKIEGDTTVEEPLPPGSTPTDSQLIDTGDIELNFGAAADWTTDAVDDEPAESSSASDIFGGSDEESHEHATEFGWHSAPNLFLAKNESAPSAPDSEPEPTSPPESPQFTSPLMGWAAPAEPEVSDATAVFESPPATFPSFAERDVPANAFTAPLSHVVSAGAWDFQQKSEATSSLGDGVAVSPVNFGSPANPFAADFSTVESPAPTEPAPFAFGEAASALPVSLQPELTSAEVSPSQFPSPGDAIGENFSFSGTQQFHFGAAATEADSPAASDSTPSDAIASAVSQSVGEYSAEAVEARQKHLTMLLLLVGSYASAVTMALIYLLTFGKTHPLESLPDVKVPVNKKSGDVALTYYSPKNDLAPGHVLKLGQSQRFGSVKVTPVKVTRGAVTFEHGDQKGADVRRPTEPLLKLWLKFENVSTNQTFAPLDPLLMFKRKSSKSFGNPVYANNFVGSTVDRKQGGALLYVYDHPIYSEFVMTGQKLDQPLPPGESWLTFIPSEEEAIQLSGELVWRFHFRKGYHPRSFNGVTTLVDVEFSSQDITDDSAAS